MVTKLLKQRCFFHAKISQKSLSFGTNLQILENLILGATIQILENLSFGAENSNLGKSQFWHEKFKFWKLSFFVRKFKYIFFSKSLIRSTTIVHNPHKMISRFFRAMNSRNLFILALNHSKWHRTNTLNSNLKKTFFQV